MKTQKNYLGITLVEMMVSIAIFWIGIQGFTMLFIRSWQNNAYIFEMGQSSMAISQSLNKMVVYLRQAKQADNGSYLIKSAAGNDLVFYSDFDSDDITERLHFYKSGSQILMGYTEPSSDSSHTYVNEDQATIVIANNIVNDVDVPIFYYYNNDYPESGNPLSEPTNASDIRLIKIYLQTNINPNRAPDNIELQSFAELRNIR